MGGEDWEVREAMDNTHVVAPTTLVNTMTQRFLDFNFNFSML